LIVHLSLARWRLRGGVALAAILTASIFAPMFVQAQSRNEAQLNVQIQELQDQVRTLTGQVEGLQFTLTQMQEQLQKMNDDNEFRFQQLEGGKGSAPKKTDAATQPGGATPTGALPQAPAGEQTTTGDATAPAGDATTVPPADVATTR